MPVNEHYLSLLIPRWDELRELQVALAASLMKFRGAQFVGILVSVADDRGWIVVSCDNRFV